MTAAKASSASAAEVGGRLAPRDGSSDVSVAVCARAESGAAAVAARKSRNAGERIRSPFFGSAHRVQRVFAALFRARLFLVVSTLVLAAPVLHPRLAVQRV